MVLHINVQGKIKKNIEKLKKNIQRHVLLKNKKNLLKTVFTTMGLTYTSLRVERIGKGVPKPISINCHTYRLWPMYRR